MERPSTCLRLPHMRCFRSILPEAEAQGVLADHLRLCPTRRVETTSRNHNRNSSHRKGGRSDNRDS